MFFVPDIFCAVMCSILLFVLIYFLPPFGKAYTCEGVCHSQCFKNSRTNAVIAFFSLRAACNRKVAEHNALCDQVSGLKS